MEPTAYERKLQNLMNDVQMALLDGKEIGDEGYVTDIFRRMFKAKTALKKLETELFKEENKYGGR